MATIDIGKIKPVFKGAYNNSTAYVLDDIVYYNGSSYVAKQSTTGNVPTNGTYWEVLASGSGGIWDANLSIGSAGQVVKVNSGATALEFGTAPSGDLVRVVTASGDGTAVLDLDSCFSSTYENYRIYGNIHTSTATNVNIRLQNASNSEITSGYYYVGYQAYKNSGAQGNDIKTGWNQNQWQPQESVHAETDGFGQIIVDVARPFVSGRTTSMQIFYTTYDSSAFRYVHSYCQQRDANTHAGFRFYVDSGNITSSSSISVYGIKNS